MTWRARIISLAVSLLISLPISAGWYLLVLNWTYCCSTVGGLPFCTENGQPYMPSWCQNDLLIWSLLLLPIILMIGTGYWLIAQHAIGRTDDKLDETAE